MAGSRIRIAFRTDASDAQLRLIRQMGATDVVTGRPAGEEEPVWSLESILALKRRIESFGLTFSVVELIPIADRVKIGAPGRDEDIDHFCRSIRNLGRAGIPILAYNWMAGMTWFRTSTATPVRGGALSTAYSHRDMQRLPPSELVGVAEEQLWAGLEYFLRAVVPVAEASNVKLAIHPDDPPVSPVRGVARILTSPAALQRAVDIVPSECNGLTFCQGCFGEMGADIPENVRRFGGQKKIFFAHFRNLRGTAESFVETFHDEGQLDMFAAMKSYYDVGFDGPMRPDHAPTMEGESNERPGYALQGRMLAVGYMKGLIEAIEKLDQNRNFPS
jgi:mannonate dehydratase